MRTKAQTLDEAINQVSRKDKVNRGVAKARFAGEANYSVPSLERLLRGEEASPDHVRGTMKAVRRWKLGLKETELFEPVGAGEKDSA